MLKRSFIHIPGIGPYRERSIWNCGLTSWDRITSTNSIKPLLNKIIGRLYKHIQESIAALEQYDGGFYEERMPAREMWRLYPEFKDKTVFLDIETTGLFPSVDEITIVSLFDGNGVRALIRGKDLDEFPKIISKYSLIVTYNGKCFDMPFLHTKYPEFEKKYAHIDLRYPLYHLGLSGGLKEVERNVGIHREGALSLVDGFMAVSLWEEYQAGNNKALDTLLRYSLEDVVNLRPLLELVYNRNIKSLPININPIKKGVLPKIKIPFDEMLIKRLLNNRAWVNGVIVD